MLICRCLTYWCGSLRVRVGARVRVLAIVTRCARRSVSIVAAAAAAAAAAATTAKHGGGGGGGVVWRCLHCCGQCSCDTISPKNKCRFPLFMKPALWKLETPHYQSYLPGSRDSLNTQTHSTPVAFSVPSITKIVEVGARMFQT